MAKAEKAEKAEKRSRMREQEKQEQRMRRRVPKSTSAPCPLTDMQENVIRLKAFRLLGVCERTRKRLFRIK